ncbi:diacylglycerol/lipid kinase family protein [Ekhidna sp. To15]|uniref:diacylglycerol/lipid kinase family protein n=1 Tax=Ekhidna sp. To15 TaxID=3395267 RepID=UPI003F526209
MDKLKVLFVINPIAGDTDKEDLDGLIEDFCTKKDITFELLKTTGENDAESVRDSIEKFQPAVVVAGGGDGTVKLIAEQLLGTFIKLAILPLGSANGLATELNIPEDWNENLNLLVELKTKTIDAVRVDGELCLHLSDIGFNAELIKEFEEEGTRGKLGYAVSFFKKIVERKHGDFNIEIDGESYNYTAEMIVIANASSYGTGAVVNPRCDMQDGLFEVCVFKPIPRHKLPNLTWHSFVGHLEDSEYFAIHQGKKVKITAKGKHTLQVDGEVIGEVEEVKAEVVKGALEMVI